ncbi:hypothetical protein MOF52_22060, partial [Bacillus inaquosorum]
KKFLPETKGLSLEQLEDNFRAYDRGGAKKESGVEVIG